MAVRRWLKGGKRIALTAFAGLEGVGDFGR